MVYFLASPLCMEAFPKASPFGQFFPFMVASHSYFPLRGGAEEKVLFVLL